MWQQATSAWHRVFRSSQPLCLGRQRKLSCNTLDSRNTLRMYSCVFTLAVRLRFTIIISSSSSNSSNGSSGGTRERESPVSLWLPKGRRNADILLVSNPALILHGISISTARQCCVSRSKTSCKVVFGNNATLLCTPVCFNKKFFGQNSLSNRPDSSEHLTALSDAVSTTTHSHFGGTEWPPRSPIFLVRLPEGRSTRHVPPLSST